MEPEIQGRIGYDMKAHKGQCRFTASNPLDLSMPYYTVLRKGDPLINTINEGYAFVFIYENTFESLTDIHTLCLMIQIIYLK